MAVSAVTKVTVGDAFGEWVVKEAGNPSMTEWTMLENEPGHHRLYVRSDYEQAYVLYSKVTDENGDSVPEIGRKFIDQYPKFLMPLAEAIMWAIEECAQEHEVRNNWPEDGI